MRPRTIEIAGRRYAWRDILEMKRAQAATRPEQQPALFELREDRRPAGERSASERYSAPSLFSLLDNPRE